MLPSLFVSHGAPTFALEPGVIGRRLHDLGRRLARPAGIVVISAHWQSQQVCVTGHAAPPTIHDFRGFDPALSEIAYPAPGHPALAGRTVDLLEASGWNAEIDATRGFDHGAWVPLLHMYPEADVPMLQVSLPRALDGVGAWRFGRDLAILREFGVLLIGSGSLTHGLKDFFGGARAGLQEARRFRKWLLQTVTTGNSDALQRHWIKAPGARRVHPTPEHYLPLVVAAAAGGLGEVELIEGGWMGEVLAMDAFVFGSARSFGGNALSAA